MDITTLQQHFLSGVQAEKAGRLEDAIRYYQQVLKTEPNHLSSHYNLANVYALQSQFEQAALHYQSILAPTPTSASANANTTQYARVHYNYALVLVQMDKPDTAITHLTQATQLKPDYIEAHHLLACTWMKQHQFLQAVQSFERTLQLAPHHAEAHCHFGLLLLQCMEVPAAKTHLEHALANNPTLSEAYYHLGIIALWEGLSEKALDYFQQTVDRDNNHFGAYYNLGLLHKEQGLNKLAQHYFNEAKRIDPEDERIAFILNGLAGDCAPMPAFFVQQLFGQYASVYDVHMQETLQYRVPQLLRCLLQETGINQAPLKMRTPSSLRAQRSNPGLSPGTLDCFAALAMTRVSDPASSLADARGSESRALLRILDLGCGTGLAGACFKDLAAHMVGIDISADMIREAEKRGCYDVLCIGDVLTQMQSMPAETVDLIIAADVLGYISDLSRVLQEAYRLLCPGGGFLFSIECTTEDADAVLQPCLRFAHNPDRLEAKTLANGFVLKQGRSATLRLQAGEDVRGGIYWYEKQRVISS